MNAIKELLNPYRSLGPIVQHGTDKSLEKMTFSDLSRGTRFKVVHDPKAVRPLELSSKSTFVNVEKEYLEMKRMMLMRFLRLMIEKSYTEEAAIKYILSPGVLMEIRTKIRNGTYWPVQASILTYEQALLQMYYKQHLPISLEEFVDHEARQLQNVLLTNYRLGTKYNDATFVDFAGRFKPYISNSNVEEYLVNTMPKKRKRDVQTPTLVSRPKTDPLIGIINHYLEINKAKIASATVSQPPLPSTVKLKDYLAMDDIEMVDGKLSAHKAREILHDKSVRGHRLTPRQRRFMGFVAGGGHPTRLRNREKATTLQEIADEEDQIVDVKMNEETDVKEDVEMKEEPVVKKEEKEPEKEEEETEETVFNYDTSAAVIDETYMDVNELINEDSKSTLQQESESIVREAALAGTLSNDKKASSSERIKQAIKGAGSEIKSVAQEKYHKIKEAGKKKWGSIKEGVKKKFTGVAKKLGISKQKSTLSKKGKSWTLADIAITVDSDIEVLPPEVQRLAAEVYEFAAHSDRVAMNELIYGTKPVIFLYPEMDPENDFHHAIAFEIGNDHIYESISNKHYWTIREDGVYIDGACLPGPEYEIYETKSAYFVVHLNPMSTYFV
jgi:hypothetical protein